MIGAAATPAAPGLRLLGVRVTGTLTADAQLLHTTGNPPRAYLVACIQPPEGLPYLARVDIGTDLVEQMHAQQLLPALRQALHDPRMPAFLCTADDAPLVEQLSIGVGNLQIVNPARSKARKLDERKVGITAYVSHCGVDHPRH